MIFLWRDSLLSLKSQFLEDIVPPPPSIRLIENMAGFKGPEKELARVSGWESGSNPGVLEGERIADNW